MITTHTCPRGHIYPTVVAKVLKHAEPQPLEQCPVCPNTDD